MRRLPSLEPPSEKAERNLSPILAEMVQHFRWRDKTIPLSSSSQAARQPQAAASAEPASVPLYYVCFKTSPRED